MPAKPLHQVRFSLPLVLHDQAAKISSYNDHGGEEADIDRLLGAGTPIKYLAEVMWGIYHPTIAEVKKVLQAHHSEHSPLLLSEIETLTSQLWLAIQQALSASIGDKRDLSRVINLTIFSNDQMVKALEKNQFNRALDLLLADLPLAEIKEGLGSKKHEALFVLIELFKYILQYSAKLEVLEYGLAKQEIEQEHYGEVNFSVGEGLVEATAGILEEVELLLKNTQLYWIAKEGRSRYSLVIRDFLDGGFARQCIIEDNDGRRFLFSDLFAKQIVLDNDFFCFFLNENRYNQSGLTNANFLAVNADQRFHQLFEAYRQQDADLELTSLVSNLMSANAVWLQTLPRDVIFKKFTDNIQSILSNYQLNISPYSLLTLMNQATSACVQNALFSYSEKIYLLQIEKNQNFKQELKVKRLWQWMPGRYLEEKYVVGAGFTSFKQMFFLRRNKAEQVECEIACFPEFSWSIPDGREQEAGSVVDDTIVFQTIFTFCQSEQPGESIPLAFCDDSLVGVEFRCASEEPMFVPSVLQVLDYRTRLSRLPGFEAVNQALFVEGRPLPSTPQEDVMFRERGLQEKLQSLLIQSTLTSAELESPLHLMVLFCQLAAYFPREREFYQLLSKLQQRIQAQYQTYLAAEMPDKVIEASIRCCYRPILRQAFLQAYAALTVSAVNGVAGNFQGLVREREGAYGQARADFITKFKKCYTAEASLDTVSDFFLLFNTYYFDPNILFGNEQEGEVSLLNQLLSHMLCAVGLGVREEKLFNLVESLVRHGMNLNELLENLISMRPIENQALACKLLRMFLEQGADANLKNDGGISVLQRVFNEEKPIIFAKILVEYGADFFVVNVESNQQHAKVFLHECREGYKNNLIKLNKIKPLPLASVSAFFEGEGRFIEHSKFYCAWYSAVVRYDQRFFIDSMHEKDFLERLDPEAGLPLLYLTLEHSLYALQRAVDTLGISLRRKFVKEHVDAGNNFLHMLAKYGTYEAMQFVLQKMRDHSVSASLPAFNDFFSENAKGETVFHLLLKRKDKKGVARLFQLVLRYLTGENDKLERALMVCDNERLSVVQLAAQEGQVKVLIICSRLGINLDTYPTERNVNNIAAVKMTPVHLATKFGRLAVVAFLCDHVQRSGNYQPLTDPCAEHGSQDFCFSPMHFNVRDEGSSAIAELMLTVLPEAIQVSAVNASAIGNLTPILLAIAKRQVTMLEVLIRHRVYLLDAKNTTLDFYPWNEAKRSAKLLELVAKLMLSAESVGDPADIRPTALRQQLKGYSEIFEEMKRAKTLGTLSEEDKARVAENLVNVFHAIVDEAMDIAEKRRTADSAYHMRLDVRMHVLEAFLFTVRDYFSQLFSLNENSRIDDQELLIIQLVKKLSGEREGVWDNIHQFFLQLNKLGFLESIANRVRRYGTLLPITMGRPEQDDLPHIAARAGNVSMLGWFERKRVEREKLREQRKKEKKDIPLAFNYAFQPGSQGDNVLHCLAKIAFSPEPQQATEAGEILEGYSSLWEQGNDDGFWPVQIAIANDAVWLVRLYVKQFNLSDNQKFIEHFQHGEHDIPSPLHHVATMGCSREMMVEFFQFTFKENQQGRTPLELALTLLAERDDLLMPATNRERLSEWVSTLVTMILAGNSVENNTRLKALRINEQTLAYFAFQNNLPDCLPSLLSLLPSLKDILPSENDQDGLVRLLVEYVKNPAAYAAVFNVLMQYCEVSQAVEGWEVFLNVLSGYIRALSEHTDDAVFVEQQSQKILLLFAQEIAMRPDSLGEAIRGGFVGIPGYRGQALQDILGNIPLLIRRLNDLVSAIEGFPRFLRAPVQAPVPQLPTISAVEGGTMAQMIGTLLGGGGNDHEEDQPGTSAEEASDSDDDEDHRANPLFAVPLSYAEVIGGHLSEEDVDEPPRERLVAPPRPASRAGLSEHEQAMSPSVPARPRSQSAAASLDHIGSRPQVPPRPAGLRLSASRHTQFANSSGSGDESRRSLSPAFTDP